MVSLVSTIHPSKLSVRSISEPKAKFYCFRNYINQSAPAYTYYVRKHSPLAMANSVSGVPARALRLKNCKKDFPLIIYSLTLTDSGSLDSVNGFAADVNANVLPQWTFITPNLVNDVSSTV